MICVGSNSPALEKAMVHALRNLGTRARLLASDWVPFGRSPSWCYSHTWPRFTTSLSDCTGLLWLRHQDVPAGPELVRLAVLRWLVARFAGRNIRLLVVGPAEQANRAAGLLGIDCTEPHLASVLRETANWEHAATKYVPPILMEHMDVCSLYLVALQQTLHELKNGNLVSGELFSQNCRRLGELFAAIADHFRAMTPNPWSQQIDGVCAEALRITKRESFPLKGVGSAGASSSLEEHLAKWNALNTEAGRQVERFDGFLREFTLKL